MLGNGLTCQNRAASSTWNPASANTMVVAITFHSRSWLPVTSLRNPMLSAAPTRST
jgi:hypothetical protein